MKYFTVLALALSICACSRHSSSHDISSNFSKQDFTIKTRDHNIIMGLSDSTVYMELSQKMLNQANDDLAGEKNPDNDWTEEFTNFVKSHVRELINSKIEYRLSDIKSISYDDGMVFKYKHKHLFSFEQVINKDSPALKNFSKKDAKAFIAHFNALKSSGTN